MSRKSADEAYDDLLLRQHRFVKMEHENARAAEKLLSATTRERISLSNDMIALVYPHLNDLKEAGRAVIMESLVVNDPSEVPLDKLSEDYLWVLGSFTIDEISETGIQVNTFILDTPYSKKMEIPRRYATMSKLDFVEEICDSIKGLED